MDQANKSECVKILDEVSAVLVRPTKLNGFREQRLASWPESVTDECVRKLHKVQERIKGE
jgi:hypothetical protein